MDFTLSMLVFIFLEKVVEEGAKALHSPSSAISDPNPVTLMEDECFH